MKLGDLLEVCRDGDVEIVDRKGKRLVCGSQYSNVCEYLGRKVLDISTRGYEKIYITIDYIENTEGINEKSNIK